MPRISLEQFGFGAKRLCPPRRMERIHHHNEVELNLAFSGKVTYLHRGASRVLSPGCIVVFWGAVPHSVVSVARGSDMAWITIPLAEVREWGLDARFVGRLLRGDWCEGPAGSGMRFPVAAWVRELEQATSPREVEGVHWELRGCLAWLAKRVASGGDRGSRSEPSRPAETMARVMAERYQEPIGVREIARAAGLHPNYAMSLFKRTCGMTVRDYLVQLRVNHAQRRLLESDAKVTDVAMESGFSTLSAFYEAFSRSVGQTPRAFRARFTLTK